jgi:hypothetical protein
MLYSENFNDAWQFPTGPFADTFGVPVPESGKTFGIEEFNLNPFLLKEKIAYVPCFATAKYYPRNSLKELKLIFKTQGRCQLHYATLHDVTPILNTEIEIIRNIIQPLMQEIYFSQKSLDFFGEDYENFIKIITRMKDSNVIASNHNYTPFLVNLRYKELEILKNPIICELSPNNVNQWKIEAAIPGNCSI